MDYIDLSLQILCHALRIVIVGFLEKVTDKILINDIIFTSKTMYFCK